MKVGDKFQTSVKIPIELHNLAKKKHINLSHELTEALRERFSPDNVSKLELLKRIAFLSQEQTTKNDKIAELEAKLKKIIKPKKAFGGLFKTDERGVF
jgi:hypothetical protein